MARSRQRFVPPRDSLFAAAGTLQAAYAAVDWAATPLGPPERWSPTLRSTVDLVLNSRFPITLFWGPEFVLVYNEAYVPLIADKHPAALGRPAEQVFQEAWATLGPMMQRARGGGGATWVEDALVPMERRGRLEEAYFTFSYSPVHGADGEIEGVIDIASETSRAVIGRRRLALLGQLRELIGTTEHAADLRNGALRLLAADQNDFPRVEVVGGGPGEATVDATSEGLLASFELDAAARERVRVGITEQLADDPDYLAFLRLLAFTLHQGMARVAAREIERDDAALERRLSETLQRSLLTPPVDVEGLDITARYFPAARRAQIGGDWYDTFALPGGHLAAVIGDVAGHDRLAAAAMAQLRNLLRGIALTVDGAPSEVLRAVDRALAHLPEEVSATAIFSRLAPGPEGHRLQWSNAGHPPPVLLHADGSTEVLERRAALLLGFQPVERDDHAVDLPPGSAVVFYTDGLIERRGASLDDGIAWLCSRLEHQQDATAAQLMDHVLDGVEDVDDDVVVLVIRVVR